MYTQQPPSASPKKHSRFFSYQMMAKRRSTYHSLGKRIFFYTLKKEFLRVSLYIKNCNSFKNFKVYTRFLFYISILEIVLLLENIFELGITRMRNFELLLINSFLNWMSYTLVAMVFYV